MFGLKGVMLRRGAVFLVSLLVLGGCKSSPENTPTGSADIKSLALGCEQTYYDTSPFSEYLGPGWQTAASASKLIIVSDPQPFYEETESSWNTKMTRLATMLSLQRGGSAYVPMIINGDITHFGHGNERKAFRKAIVNFASGKPGPLFFPGLGNHDYDQNVGDCANNGCARDAVCDHIIWTKAIKASASGMNFDHDFAGDRHTGSLSYSVDIGNLHVVQLNLEPTYTVNFSTGGLGAPGAKREFNVTSSMSWLEKDLIAAKARGKYTIINMHQEPWWQDDAVRKGKFVQLVESNRVVGVFSGHWHWMLGRNKESFGKVPSFRSGSMPSGGWLRLLFDWDKKILQVDAYNVGSHVEEYKYNMDTFQDLTPPPPPKPVKVTLYSGRNFTGTTCSTSLGEGERKDLSSWCSALVNKPGASMKVTDFGYGASSLCLAIPYDLMYKRCYKGAYRGDFEVSDFSKPGQLPAGLYRDALGTEDKGFGTVNYLKP